MVTSLLALAAVCSPSFTPSHFLVLKPALKESGQLAPSQPAPLQSSTSMSTVQTFVRSARMLRTPKLDGMIDGDWDVLFDNRLRSGPITAGGINFTGGTPAVNPVPVSAVPTPAAGTAPVPVAGGPVPVAPPASPTQPAPTPPVKPAGPPQTTPPQTTPPQTVPAPLSGTPIRRSPDPDPNSKPKPAPVTPAPVPVPVPVPVAPQAPPMMAPLGVQAAFLNWEPGKIYLAAIIPTGQDLVISIDGKGDGFLVGKDNVELRITPGPMNLMKARVLDATNPAGPVWSDAPGFVTASQVVTSISGGTTVVEIALVDPGYEICPAKLGDKFAVRFDSVTQDTPPSPPFVPRVTTPVTLVDQYSEGFPANFKVNVPARGRGAFPEDSTTVKWQFSSTPGTTISRFDISGEGWLNNFVNSLSVPAPAFDRKGNSTVDYFTKVVKGAPVGFGVLKGVLSGPGWGPALSEVSFRVPPPMDLDIPAKNVKFSDKPQRVKAVVDIRSNSDRRIEGHLQILPPAGWTVRSGSDRNFYVYNRRGSVPSGFELEIPGGTQGSFPVTLRVAALGKLTDQTFWVTIR